MDNPLCTIHWMMRLVQSWVSLDDLTFYSFFSLSRKVTCQSWAKPTGFTFSSSVIGTDSCYGLFERGEKTVQAKNIKICVGGPSKKIVWAALYYIISITIGYDFFTGTTYANFDIFCLYSFFSSFEQAIARVCTYHRTRESDVDRFVSTLTSDLT